MTNTNEFRKELPEAAAGADGSSQSNIRFSKQAARLRREVPLTKVVGEYTRLRGPTKRLIGTCPRHEKPNPTLRVYPKTNTFECSFCGMRGDAIAFLETVEDLTYGQALEALEKLRYSDEYPDSAQ